jgi:Peptidase A4 family
MMCNGSLAGLVVALISLVSASAAVSETGISWSGYVVKSANLGSPAPPTTFTFVTAIWKQPVVTCPVADARVAFWVGLDGDGTPTVEQAGTVVTCSATNQPPVYKAFWEMYDANGGSRGAEPFIVSPGDIIEASASYVGGSYLLQLKDLTNGGNFFTTQTRNPNVVCKRGTVEWIVERPGDGAYPLADYSTVEFANVEELHSGPRPVRSEINMVNAPTTLSVCEPAALGQQAEFSTPFWNLTDAFNCRWQAAE